MAKESVQFILNGTPRLVEVATDDTAVEVIRDACGFTGTKLVCGAGVCGACTVLVDGVPQVACLRPAKSLGGTSLVTVEGVGATELHPVQRAFLAMDALQCGFCTPGFIVEAAHFYDERRRAGSAGEPSREEVAAALAGHLCRCGAYDNILAAVQAACAGRFDKGPDPFPARHEARAKVTGAARYTVDVKLPGQLEGGIFRSPHAHARVRRISFERAQELPGVRAVVCLLESERVVRYVGDAVAAVAADSLSHVRAALHAIEVDWEVLPSTIGPAASQHPNAPLVYPGFRKKAPNSAEGPVMPTPWKGNVRGPSASFALAPRAARRALADARECGDVHLVEHTFQTGGQSHTSFEPHAAVAHAERDALTVYVSTQAVGAVHKHLANHFKLDPARIRVIAEHVGGAFGSKLTLGTETIAAVELARAAKAPVRVALSRHEELSVTGYRPPTTVQVSLLPNGAGGLEALSIHCWADTGVSINSTAAALARLIYPAPAKDLVDYDVVSHLPPGAPFRGPGGPAVVHALEAAVDDAAERMGTDPLTLRQRWDPDAGRQRLYRWAGELETWRQRAPNGVQTGRHRTGIGIAAAHWFYWWQPGVEVELRIENGRLIAQTGTQDMGTGSRSAIAQALAEALGVLPNELAVHVGDSTFVAGAMSGGSRTTASMVPAALDAAARLKRALAGAYGLDEATAHDWRPWIAKTASMSVVGRREPDDATISPGVVSPLTTAGMMGKAFQQILKFITKLETGRGGTGAVMVAQVSVDTALGHVRVDQMHCGLAIGRPIVPQLAQAQVIGAVVQGIGHALYEERQLDLSLGVTLSGGLEDYRIPGIADVPRVEVYFDPEGFEHVAGGGVGLGEICTLPVAAAVANAVTNAIGVRPTTLPMIPSRILSSLGGPRA